MLESVEDTALFDDATAVTSAVLAASRLLVAVSLRSLAAEQQVTLPQFRLLVLLDGHGETTLVALGERLAVNSSTALRMVDRLAARGLVSRRVNPASRREVLLRLTGAGQRIVDEVTVWRQEEIAAIVARMPARARVGLVKAMRSFAAAGGEPSDEEDAERDPVPLGWK